MRRTMTAGLVAAVAMTPACSRPSDERVDAATKKVAITITRDSVTPQAKTLDLDVDQPLQLDVTADVPGQLHVHSSPVHTFDYEAGHTTITFAFDKPGIVDVESHALDELILKLRVQ